jgi:hypothetical protein
VQEAGLIGFANIDRNAIGREKVFDAHVSAPAIARKRGSKAIIRFNQVIADGNPPRFPLECTGAAPDHARSFV